MPWCDKCDKWRSPGGVLPDGTCPRCGTQVEQGAVAVEVQDRVEQAQVAAKIPWHFWVMVAAVVLYLGWRIVQGAGALF